MLALLPARLDSAACPPFFPARRDPARVQGNALFNDRTGARISQSLADQAEVAYLQILAKLEDVSTSTGAFIPQARRCCR